MWCEGVGTWVSYNNNNNNNNNNSKPLGRRVDFAVPHLRYSKCQDLGSGEAAGLNGSVKSTVTPSKCLVLE